MTHLLRRFMTAIFLSVSTIAMADPSGTPSLQLDKPWLKTSIPGSTVGAGYVTLRNTSNLAIEIIGFESDIASDVELHSMSTENGVMKMRHLASLRIPANGSAKLEPGANHIMLMGLRRPLLAGDTVAIRFKVKDGQALDTTFRVRDNAP